MQALRKLENDLADLRRRTDALRKALQAALLDQQEEGHTRHVDALERDLITLQQCHDTLTAALWRIHRQRVSDLVMVAFCHFSVDSRNQWESIRETGP